MGESNSIKLSGAGLHSGFFCNVDFHLGEPSPFPVVKFNFPGFANRSIKDLLAMPRHAVRSTVLLGETGREPINLVKAIRTPEHLLASLLFFAEQPLMVNCDAGELPGFDGSALVYREALSKLLPQCAKSPTWQEYAADLVWSHDWGYGYLKVKPSENFSVRYMLDRKGFHQSFTLDNPLLAWNEILPARTFAFYSEWQQARAAGLMAGADLDSGLLLAETEVEHAELLRMHSDWKGRDFPLLNQPYWRMENELVKHKILDLLGDLALAGLALPKLELEICNGGHSINHLLLEKLTLN